MEEFVGNFYTYDSAGYLVENDDEGQNEIDFNTVDITIDVLLKKTQARMKHHENESQDDG